MGYSHYFAYDPTAESFVAAWPRIVTDARLIAWYVQRVLDIPLANGMGEGRPEVSERRIWLNGPAALGHGTFLIDPTGERLGAGRECRCPIGFCKTALKPYDIAVTSILLRCHRLAPAAFVVASDGGWEHDWCQGSRTARGYEQGSTPATVVELLFAQVEPAENSRLAPSVSGAPPLAHD